MSLEAMKQALEALELMYACYAHSEWISHKQQEEKILAQCVATTMTLRQAIAEASQNGLYREGYRNGYGFGEAAGKRQAIAEAEKQEPVGRFAKFTDDTWREVTDYSAGVPLYTHPQQRIWVDLTDDEMLMIYGQQHEGKKYSLGRMVQQALKEKNT
jgi:hypothetical protein